MFAISHEVPIELLEESRNFNDYDYALVHIFDKSQKYFDFYKQSIKSGRRVILDNSAYELGAPYDEARYKIYLQRLQPTEYILPDYRDDAAKNLKAISEWDYRHSSAVKIGVVHGANYRSFCQNYRDIKRYVHKIAISAESFFDEYAKIRNITLAEARVSIIEDMVKDGVIDISIPHHILGALSPTEYQSYVKYNWIQSADTSNPVLHGLLDICYTGEDGLKGKSKTKLDSLMFESVTMAQRDVVGYNVEWFRNQFEEMTEPVAQIVESQVVDNCPARYASRKVHGMDVIALVKFWNLNFNEGSILKYLLRDKGEDISDMEKIGVFAQRELEYLKKE